MMNKKQRLGHYSEMTCTHKRRFKGVAVDVWLDD